MRSSYLAYGWPIPESVGGAFPFLPLLEGLFDLAMPHGFTIISLMRDFCECQRIDGDEIVATRQYQG
jgi:hypothetical protein